MASASTNRYVFDPKPKIDADLTRALIETIRLHCRDETTVALQQGSSFNIACKLHRYVNRNDFGWQLAITVTRKLSPDQVTAKHFMLPGNLRPNPSEADILAYVRPVAAMVDEAVYKILNEKIDPPAPRNEYDLDALTDDLDDYGLEDLIQKRPLPPAARTAPPKFVCDICGPDPDDTWGKCPHHPENKV